MRHRCLALFLAAAATTASGQKTNICETSAVTLVKAHDFVRGRGVIKSALPHDPDALSSPGKSAAWEYEFTVARNCTMKVEVEYASLGGGRRLSVSRLLLPRVGPRKVTSDQHLGTLEASDTKGWATFQYENLGNVGFLSEYITVLRFTALGTEIPHVRMIRLSPAF